MNTRFSDSLKNRSKAGFTPVIPDIKCRSPKQGDLLKGRDPVQVAASLATAGAPVLSVVTEQKDFGGSLAMLEQIVQTTKLPVLRKDFITNSEDITATARAGASAVLLISSLLEQKQLQKLYEQALALGLEPLVETHQASELAFASALGSKLTGINNRDIRILERDNGTVSATADLAPYKPADSLLISESAIQSEQDVRQAISAGADAVLVGTALWQAPDMLAFYMQLSRTRRMLKICGLMNTAGVNSCLNLGVDILGFVTEYPVAVPWNLNRDQALPLISQVRNASDMARSCLVTGGDRDHIINLARSLRPDLVQLHYHESLSDTIKITQALKPLGIGIIKTLPTAAAERQNQFGTSDLDQAAAALNQTDIYAILADTRSSANADSNQLQLNAEFCRQVVNRSTKPVFAAGGIKPDQVRDVVSSTGTGLIDIMTGTESRPGSKNHKLIELAVKKSSIVIRKQI